MRITCRARILSANLSQANPRAQILLANLSQANPCSQILVVSLSCANPLGQVLVAKSSQPVSRKKILTGLPWVAAAAALTPTVVPSHAKTPTTCTDPLARQNAPRIRCFCGSQSPPPNLSRRNSCTEILTREPSRWKPSGRNPAHKPSRMNPRVANHPRKSPHIDTSARIPGLGCPHRDPLRETPARFRYEIPLWWCQGCSY
ncbi:hypothetical protein DFH07DRAFT_788298 [Mycena maculata]|uniref:Uncharacterized protein n=1 Tax=Mycena maculata TaxID=230809 RepID=A0AAD7KDW2_9AGAR|nr:hypothetical protein DFH07DRAFT_788298 [Mycena maculata]